MKNNTFTKNNNSHNLLQINWPLYRCIRSSEDFNAQKLCWQSLHTLKYVLNILYYVRLFPLEPHFHFFIQKSHTVVSYVNKGAGNGSHVRRVKNSHAMSDK